MNELLFVWVVFGIVCSFCVIWCFLVVVGMECMVACMLGVVFFLR